MEIDELHLKWAEYRFKVKQFEKEKEEKVRRRNPSFSQAKIDAVVYSAVERKFNGEALHLLRLHLDLTSSFRNL